MAQHTRNEIRIGKDLEGQKHQINVSHGRRKQKRVEEQTIILSIEHIDTQQFAQQAEQAVDGGLVEHS